MSILGQAISAHHNDFARDPRGGRNDLSYHILYDAGCGPRAAGGLVTIRVLTWMSVVINIHPSAAVNPNTEPTMTITQKAVAAQVRPLRETVERSLDWEGRFTQPAPVQIGAYTVSVAVVYQRGVRIPFAIWYRASLDGRTVIEVDRQPEFVRLLTARLNKEAL